MYDVIRRLPKSWWSTLCLMVGISVGYIIEPLYAVYYAALIIFILLWLQEYYCSFMQKIFLYGSWSLLGYVVIQHQISDYKETIKHYADTPLWLIATVTDHTQTPHLPLKNKITLSLEHLSQDNGVHWKKISGYSLTIQTQKSHDSLVGSKIMVHDITLKSPSDSFALFCIRTRLLAAAHKPQLSYALMNRPYFSWARMLYRYKNNMLNFFKTHMNAPTFTLFAALFLGNNDPIKIQIKKYQIMFQNWGIIHYLARSGLHLVIVTALLEYMLYILPLPFTIGRIIILWCALLYSILSWVSLSFYRALAVFIFSGCARIARRQHHFLHLLLLTCSLFLILNPIALFFLDFQLTFGITIALGLFNYATYKTFN